MSERFPPPWVILPRPPRGPMIPEIRDALVALQNGTVLETTGRTVSVHDVYDILRPYLAEVPPCP